MQHFGIFVLTAMAAGTLGCGTSSERWWETPSTPSSDGSAPASVVSIVLEPRALIGGMSSTATVSVYPAPRSGGTVVSLSANHSAITMPLSVEVPAGSGKASFTVTTRPVPVDVTTMITGAAAGARGTATLDLWTVLPTSVHWLTEPLSPTIGFGRWDRLTPQNATFLARCENGSELNMSASTPEFNRRVTLFLAAPRGAPLRPGTYNGAVRVNSRPAGVPGMDLGLDGTACDLRSGRFVVSEVDLSPTGEVRRFVASFEARCGFSESLVTGEVRLTGPFQMPQFSVSCLR